MSGRPKIYEETEVIDKAIAVFWQKGYEAASADALLAAMGIGKGSFYLQFKGGKKELFDKSLEQFAKRSSEQFQTALAKAPDPVDFIRGFFLALADAPVERQLNGCYLGNAVMEMTHIDKDMQQKAVHLLAQLEQRFREIIGQAQQTGRISSSLSPELLARTLINLWNGINVTRRMYPQDTSIRTVIELQLKILD
ncbi:MAG TPA: TetR/AcrR family transcriptional regulator [Cytophagales bacterium]|nr:TetR/AcrR family transcriptional regulator [Cytophagales bacterium]